MQEQSIQETLAQLERMDQLMEEIQQLDQYLEYDVIVEYKEKIIQTIKTEDDLQPAPSVFHSLPTFPIDGADMNAAKIDYQAKLKLLLIVAAATLVIYLLSQIISWSLLTSIATIGIVVAVFFGFVLSTSRKKYMEKKKAYDDAMNAHISSMSAFRDALQQYDAQKASCIKAAKEFSAEYTDIHARVMQLYAEMSRNRKQAQEESREKTKELESMQILPEQYHYLVQSIILILRSGRADTLKEAINLAIQEDRAERAEAARQAEEARRTQIMQEQARNEQLRLQEERRHNQEMEREQQRQTAMAAREMEQNRKMQSENDKKGHSKCTMCVHKSRCQLTGAYGSGLNCGAFQPR